jgi:hypothetical protein
MNDTYWLQKEHVHVSWLGIRQDENTYQLQTATKSVDVSSETEIAADKLEHLRSADEYKLNYGQFWHV